MTLYLSEEEIRILKLYEESIGDFSLNERMRLIETNSFATKGKGTWGKADSDLAAKVRSESVDEQVNVERTRLQIAREKAADKEKHKRMIDTARERDRAMKEEKDPSKREQGTDSLVRVYKKDTPGEKVESYFNTEIGSTFGNFRKGDRIKFTAHSMDMFDGEPREGTIVGTNVQHLRVRDDDGVLYKVRHDDAEVIEEATTVRGFEGKTISVKNEPVRMIDGKLKSLPPGKSASSKNGGNGD
jgi:sRNA-binding protein